MSTSWERGHHPEADVIGITVVVRRDQYGRVLSAHDLQSEEDKAIALSWPSGGMEQVAFALLSEAVKREALLVVLLKASQDPEYLRQWVGSSEEEKARHVEEMSLGIRNGMSGTVSRLSADALRAALQLMAGANLPGGCAVETDPAYPHPQGGHTR